MLSTFSLWLHTSKHSFPSASTQTNSASVEEKGNKVLFHTSLAFGSTYCQEYFFTARDEFKKDLSSHLHGCRRLSDCSYQNSFPHPEKFKWTEIKDMRGKDEQTSLPLTEKCRELYLWRDDSIVQDSVLWVNTSYYSDLHGSFTTDQVFLWDWSCFSDALRIGSL